MLTSRCGACGLIRLNTGKLTRFGVRRIDRLEMFHDCTGGGAWPLVVGGVICLLNCGNGRGDLTRVVDSW